MNSKTIKVIGLIGTVLGAGATLISDWAKNKEMDEKIEKKVNEKLAANEKE